MYCIIHVECSLMLLLELPMCTLRIYLDTSRAYIIIFIIHGAQNIYLMYVPKMFRYKYSIWYKNIYKPTERQKKKKTTYNKHHTNDVS